MPEAKNIQDELTSDYMIRTSNRTATLGQSTMALLVHLQALEPGSAEQQYTAAKAKVQQFSQEISAATPGAKTDFMLGDTQPLIDQVNASTLPFMDAAAKQVVTDILTQA